MAKLIAFFVFMCFELSRQEEAAVVEKPRNVLLPGLPFPEQEIIQETYPLDINLDDGNDFLKSGEGIKPLPQKLENSWETDEYPEDEFLEDFLQVTLEIEDFMEKANPEMKNFKWFRVLEEASVAKGILPNCSAEWGTFDWESEEDSWLNSGNGNGKLMEEYDKLVLLIEKWMTTAIPKYRNYEWLRIWEKGNSDGCDDYDSSSYDYYYDVDLEVLSGAKDSLQKRTPASRKLKFKRFTSV